MYLKKVFLVLFVLQLTSTGIAQDKIQWIKVADIEAALAKEPRKILIDVYTNWCGPCKMMMSQTFTHPEVIKYINENFYAVKFNAEGNEVFTFNGVKYTNSSYNPGNANRRNGTHDFTMAIAPVNGKIAYPTIVYLNESLQIISPVQGFWKSKEYIPLLYFINEEVYATPTTFDTYNTNFYK